MTRSVVVLAVATLAGCASGAQPRGLQDPAPMRPVLAAAADTNDPQAYYEAGLRSLSSDLARAADAFYWAHRLDPGSADALYARRVSLHAFNIERVRGYLTTRRYAAGSPLVREIDSLQYLAIVRDPFFHARFDQQLMELARARAVRSGIYDHPRVYFTSTQYAAWRSYSEGDFKRALVLYAELMKRDTSDYHLHGARARAFYLMSEFDSALVEMTTMLERARARESKVLSPIYQSKAMTEHAIGLIQLARGDKRAARSAFQRALGEDLSFYMAHAALGDVSAALGDTATALAEWELAVQLEPNDPSLRYRYGSVLLHAGQHRAAEDQLRRAIALNDDFAHPYLPLAYILDREGRTTDAAELYAAYVARAPRSAASQLGAAKDRLAELTQSVEPSP